MATLPQLEKSITGDTVHNADEKTSISEPGLQQRSLVAEYPWRYKVPALICVLFFTLGSNWASSALSPLKSTLKEELAINNAQYGVIASANSLVNTILPIISGMAIDYYGPEIGSLLSSCFVTLGALIAAIGTTTSNYRTLIAGEVVLGLGSTTIETSQSKLYTHWFYGSHLGLVYGLDIAWGRAGYTSSLSQVIPIVLTPALGHFFDRFGKRMWFVSGTALLYIVVFSLLAFTAVHPLVPVLLSSVALSFNALPFIAAIPLLVSDQAHIGTAFGIWKAFNNAGSTVMDIATGAIQDLTPTGRNTYNNVFYLLIALKGVDVIYGLFYDRLDKWQFGSVLRMNEARRVAKEKEDSSDLQRPLKRPQKIFTYIGIGLLGSMIVVAWTLYLIYAQGS
ncbi:mfs transporter [Moniliophthora roreri]|nr:mfs transporter [Moniliophthora roreri]